MSKKIRLAVFVSGGGTNLQTIIDACAANEINAEVAFVLSSRKKVFAIERAKKAGINYAVYSPKKYNNSQEFSEAIMAELQKHNIDLVVLAGFMSILSPDFIKKYANRIMNTHPSLLPSFDGKGCYGIRVHQKVLEYGVKYTGATIMFINENIDTGPIILQEAIPVLNDDSAESLQQRVLKLEHNLYKKAIGLFAENRLKIEGRVVKILPKNKGDCNYD